jgi:ABC-type uncharacterized transport system permease subunit
MSPVFFDTLGPMVTAALYIGATVILRRATAGNSEKGRRMALGVCAAAVLVNGLVQYQAWMNQPLAVIDVATVMSLCSLVLVVLWMLTLFTRHGVIESGLLALPIAALANLLDAVFPGPSIGQESGLANFDPGTVLHVVSSIVAFGVLSLAGVYAILALAIDHSLKKHQLSRLVQNLPPLDKLEHLEFTLIATGFVLLTISLGSGLLFVNNLMAQHLVHKTVLSFMAWFVFGGLLLGRWLKGWRGSLAVRLALAGIVLLLLSYFGSKLVLEVILGRSWYS